MSFSYVFRFYSVNLLIFLWYNTENVEVTHSKINFLKLELTYEKIPNYVIAWVAQYYTHSMCSKLFKKSFINVVYLVYMKKMVRSFLFYVLVGINVVCKNKFVVNLYLI